MNEGYIYMIRNKLNGHMYIGQTINLNKRWREHINRSKSVIGKAINKYGKYNFDFLVIEKCKQEKLDEREIYWIEYYDTFEDSKHYNCLPGGNVSHRGITGEDHPSYGRKRPEKVREKIAKNHADFTEENHPCSKIKISTAKDILKDRKNGKKYLELANDYNTNHATIGEILKGEHWTCKYLKDEFEFIEPKENNKGKNNPRSKISIDMAKDIIVEYNTTEITYKGLSDKYSIGTTNIGRILNGRHWTCDKINQESIKEMI